MKAFAIQNSFGLDSLLPVELPEPKAGPGQVVVRLKAASLNYRDLLMIQGKYNPKQSLPLIPLSDGVGEIVEVGPGVTRVKTGERVAGIFAQTWLDGELTKEKAAGAMGGPLQGMLTEYALLDADGVVSVPANLTDEEASTLPCAAVTAWNALITSGNIQAGDTALVQGTGGVSLFALQFAVMSGAKVIVTSSSDEKLAKARALGASEGINYRATPDWEKRVWELTGGVGVDHIVEVGGAGTLAKSLRAARYGGVLSIIGVLSGSAPETSLALILHKNLRVQGIYVGSRTMFEAMNRAIMLHQLRPVVDRVFPINEVRAALTYLESGAHFGKVVLRIAE